ncbi:hypothetical protein FZC84_04360 [Rossellomorea vietnamensis]|uniref:YqgU-like 6-bladed beta-propeller domain-containing protein n=1 Tax=Rossellomorea vietnamensis TaxID=218284 RepID=A0A5D4MFT9_9BACI|nr:hypothetical protein [Rossellomorea vietnamensis]TYS00735.1 hypothetical protein FZC84_04360 [Rossellomorea vietnamensis]
MKKTYKLFLLLSCLFLLASCSGETPKSNKPEEKPVSENEQVKDQKEAEKKELKPLELEETSFQRVIDWIDSDRVIILSNSGNENQLLDYNIFSGEQNIIYSDEEVIVDAKISPDRQRILIHSAPLTYSASMTIIDLNGDVIFEKDIESYEVAFEWNDRNPDLLFISSFAEDWTFEVMLADLSQGSVSSVDSPQPFIKWVNESSFLYQEWPEESISLTAPLYSRNLYSEEKVLVEEETIHFDTLPPYILSISIDEGTEGKAVYQFITEEGTIASSLEQPLLSSYSNWVVPYYDKIDSERTFVSLTAGESMPEDSYQGTFTLEKWNMKTGQREQILHGLPNEPLECSPSGDYCLTGYELKQAVDLKNKEAADLVIIK